MKFEVYGEEGEIIEARLHGGYHWDSNDGFKMLGCEHRDPPCLRCRIRWLIHLWRNGNHVWYLP